MTDLTRRIVMFVVGLILGLLIGGGVVYVRDLNEKTVSTNTDKDTTPVVTAKTKGIKFSQFGFSADIPTDWYTDVQNYRDNDPTTTNDDGENSTLEISGPEGSIVFYFNADGLGGGTCEQIMDPKTNSEVLSVDTPDIQTQAGPITVCHTVLKNGSETWGVGSGNFEKVTPKQLKNKDGDTLLINADVNAPYTKNRDAVLDIIKSVKF